MMKLISIIATTLAVLGSSVLTSVYGLCTITPVNMGGLQFEVHMSWPKLTTRLKDYTCGDDPVFIDRNPFIFPSVLDFMRYGKIVLSLSVSTQSFMNELDFFEISYNEEDIIDGNKVIAALKKENEVLRQQIKALGARIKAAIEEVNYQRTRIKAAIEEVNEMKAKVAVMEERLLNSTLEACARRWY